MQVRACLSLAAYHGTTVLDALLYELQNLPSGRRLYFMTGQLQKTLLPISAELHII